MERIVSITSKLKFVGILGLPMFFSDWLIWKYLWLFWLFAFVEIICFFPLFLQSLQQLLGIPYIYLTHGFRLPNKENHTPEIYYSLPFQGQWTVVNGGVNKQTSHSWSIPTQRYAYDFVITDEEGKTCSGDPTVLANYFCYGQDVLAPADGIVVAAKDNYKDSRTFGNGRTDPFIKDIRGNYIVIKHGNKEYSVIAHLMPRSLKVKIGDGVKSGEVIAKCGNSGNTTEPHIHFQIQEGRSFLASAGLPIYFRDIQQEPIKNYHSVDPRPLPKPFEEGSPFIQRGNLVSNQEQI